VKESVKEVKFKIVQFMEVQIKFVKNVKTNFI